MAYYKTKLGIPKLKIGLFFENYEKITDMFISAIR